MTNSCLAQRGCQAGKNLKTKVLLMGDGEEEGEDGGEEGGEDGGEQEEEETWTPLLPGFILMLSSI